jgi:hypothetical protein
MSPVVIATPLTEGLPAAPHATVGTDGHSTVSAFRHSAIATRRPYVAIACSVFDLAELLHEGVRFPSSNSRCHHKMLHGYLESDQQTCRLGEWLLPNRAAAERCFKLPPSLNKLLNEQPIMPVLASETKK